MFMAVMNEVMRPVSGLGINDWCSGECRQQFRPWSKLIAADDVCVTMKCHASVNSFMKAGLDIVFISQWVSRREQNIVCIGEAEVTNTKRLHLWYCATDRHKSSRSLSASAELLLYYVVICYCVCIHAHICISMYKY